MRTQEKVNTTNNMSKHTRGTLMIENMETYDSKNIRHTIYKK